MRTYSNKKYNEHKLYKSALYKIKMKLANYGINNDDEIKNLLLWYYSQASE